MINDEYWVSDKEMEARRFWLPTDISLEEKADFITSQVEFQKEALSNEQG